MRVTRFFFTVCVVLLLFLFAGGMTVILKTEDGGRITAPLPISELTGQGFSTELELNRLESSVSRDEPVNLLVLGLDKDETRCDVMMLFHFDPETSGLKLLSIARDTRVRRKDGYDRINALYSSGREKLVAQKITEITGLPVHYYITMNFEGFRKTIDLLGGVSFYVPFRMNYDDPTQDLHIHLKKGMQLLDGKKAEQLVRYRKGNLKGQGYTEGDIDRIKMQQDFIKAMVEQKIHIKYISRVDELFQIMDRYVKTNITLTDIAQYVTKAGKIISENIETFTLPGESKMIGEKWYYIYDREKTEEMVAEHFH